MRERERYGLMMVERLTVMTEDHRRAGEDHLIRSAIPSWIFPSPSLVSSAKHLLRGGSSLSAAI
ncbi:hypothetical protein HanXRQr2_Chr03g0125461 [Helianthus annuus]|uniref:Uncharacterized protein n=1 Tax=Helianthus annuus TaxID=4232 RepID=A0A251VA64_HELAN|nr:hypothetical protein HanXRQr2_Chr03g0125461 [Helianthus annuus]KAJ0594079.1 hypothetical protein HanHA300_Chr03g0104481 [Helianthus annuus]KAJ0602167.1 hypothetical protein HanIR_Chr03g0136641 [Helianthus annuus]KAJ0774914.1 hypothetical protein HanOQP8_Chr03g0117141 [Helianthus annuus]